MKRITLTLVSVPHFFLDLLFPEKCLGCQTRGSILCDSCINKLTLVGREPPDAILAVYDYRDPLVSKIIWNLKYYNHRHLGRILGKLLYDSFMEEIAELIEFGNGAPVLVIPVPISPSRKRKRGYNQAEIIARHFCQSANNKILELKTHLVLKNKDTVSQATITNRARRLRNMQDAFLIKNKDVVKGRTDIVVDDVTTTGATLHEIMKILKSRGAKSVIGMALAH